MKNVDRRTILKSLITGSVPLVTSCFRDTNALAASGVIRADASPGTIKKPLVKGIRLDPGHLYPPNGPVSPTVAAELVGDIIRCRANTLFLYGINSVYGAFADLNYDLMSTESGLGKTDFVHQVIQLAKDQGISVVISIPLNNFKSAWEQRPTWRVKQKIAGGVSDYKPNVEAYPLSSWVDDVRDWIGGLVSQVCHLWSDSAGIEIREPEVNHTWNDPVDFNAATTQKFSTLYPRISADPRSPDWRRFTAMGLTDMHAIVARQIHNYRKECWIVQTWPPDNAGNLMDATDVRDGSGFDFGGVLNLSRLDRADNITAELIWQQWSADKHLPIFSPEWTGDASKQFSRFVGDRANAITHVEATGFPVGDHPTITPNDAQLQRSIRLALENTNGVAVYEYMLLKRQGLLPAVREAFS